MGDISLRGKGRAFLAKGTLPDLTGDGKITRADVLKGRGVFKKGGKAMDESMAHEGMESMKMESKETRMERKGFRENKKGSMVKMAKGGMTKSQETVKTAMSKFKKGKLHSGSKKGPVVKSRKQAIAIALSEAGKSKKK
jgi:hypothetical protein